MQEISVYLFLGFLDSGKTKFIQETLEDERMETGERTMLLVCEEGEEEYAPEKFAVKNVAVEHIEKPEDLNEGNLYYLTRKNRAKRVVVEYNGTWLLQQFFDDLFRQRDLYKLQQKYASACFRQDNNDADGRIQPL